MLHINIPKPCHEDWNEMTPNQQGRHCNVCCKTVVDFTSMNDSAIKYFFLNKKKEESVCGRFKTEQLQRINITLPYNIYTISMPLWKQFLTACLLAFSSMLFSCDAMVGNNTTGDVMGQSTGKTVVNQSALNIDTTTKTSCSTIIGDSTAIQIISVSQGETMGLSSVENIIPTEILLPTVEKIDTLKTILKGDVEIDTSGFINSQKIDTIKKNKDSSTCDNQFLNL